MENEVGSKCGLKACFHHRFGLFISHLDILSIDTLFRPIAEVKYQKLKHNPRGGLANRTHPGRNGIIH